MTTPIAFIIGMIIATPIGFLACAILTVGKNADLDSKITELRQKLDEKDMKCPYCGESKDVVFRDK